MQIVIMATANTSCFAFLTAMAHGCEKRVIGTDRHQVQSHHSRVRRRSRRRHQSLAIAPRIDRRALLHPDGRDSHLPKSARESRQLARFGHSSCNNVVTSARCGPECVEPRHMVSYLTVCIWKGDDMSIIARVLLAIGLLALPVIGTASAGTSPCATAACTRGAPGPIAGAGVPVLVLGGLIYWVFSRRRSQ
jgi:hypothetical protein